MFDFQGDVLIEDEFLRDGLQNEARILTVEERLDFLAALESAGLRRIRIGSFVRPKWVPQMACTDELFERIEPSKGRGPHLRGKVPVPIYITYELMLYQETVTQTLYFAFQALDSMLQS